MSQNYKLRHGDCFHHHSHHPHSPADIPACSQVPGMATNSSLEIVLLAAFMWIKLFCCIGVVHVRCPPPSTGIWVVDLDRAVDLDRVVGLDRVMGLREL